MMNISGPREGDFITIKSYKHDGSLHRTWRDTMVLKTSENALIGCNDHTLVTESDGRRWITREPALVYFHKHYWFNIVTMIRENGVSYYCNLASPAVLDKEALKYIDYDLDVKVFPNGEKRLLDVDEYEDHGQDLGDDGRNSRSLYVHPEYSNEQQVQDNIGKTACYEEVERASAVSHGPEDACSHVVHDDRYSSKEVYLHVADSQRKDIVRGAYELEHRLCEYIADYRYDKPSDQCKRDGCMYRC